MFPASGFIQYIPSPWEWPFFLISLQSAGTDCTENNYMVGRTCACIAYKYVLQHLFHLFKYSFWTHFVAKQSTNSCFQILMNAKRVVYIFRVKKSTFLHNSWNKASEQNRTRSLVGKSREISFPRTSSPRMEPKDLSLWFSFLKSNTEILVINSVIFETTTFLNQKDTLFQTAFPSIILFSIFSVRPRK